MAKHGGFETAEIDIPEGFWRLGKHVGADAIEDELERLRSASTREPHPTSPLRAQR